MSDRSWRGAVTGGLLATLEQPVLWPVALAGFLARGGLIAFLWPILVLPTPAGIQAILSPMLVPVVFGQLPIDLVLLAVAGALLVAGSILAGGSVGGWADVTQVRAVAVALDRDPGARMRGLVSAAFSARALAHAPLVGALAWGSARIFEVAYAELVTPFEVATPLVLRIAAGAPDALALVIGAWLAGEAAGGLAVRDVVLRGRGPVRAAIRGWLELVRHPVSSLATFAATWLLVVVAVAPGLVAAGTAWERLRVALFDRGRPEEVVPALLAFVALWLGALVLAAVATTARSAAWTAEWLRRREPATAGVEASVGTIGAAREPDRGGWSAGQGSGTL